MQTFYLPVWRHSYVAPSGMKMREDVASAVRDGALHPKASKLVIAEFSFDDFGREIDRRILPEEQRK